MLIESFLEDLAISMVNVTSLSLLPNAASSLSLASTLYSCIKGRIVLAFEKNEEKKKELKGGQDNEVHLSSYLILRAGCIAEFSFSARQIHYTVRFTFEPDRFPTLPTKDPIPKPFKALILTFLR